MLSHIQISNELVDKKIISYSDVFDFRDTPLEALFEEFFIFCQTNLSEHCAQFDIQPARFHYTNGYQVNARAGWVNGYYLIQVNSGTIIETFKSFFANNSLFRENKEVVKKYGDIENLIKIPLGIIMFQSAVQFTYYHELAHLIQKPFQEFSSLDERNQSVKGEYSALKHSLEFDADVHAANLVPVHIIDFWRKFPQQDMTVENLSKLLAVGVSGILNYFMSMEQHYQDIYYRKSSHPHPLIRATYITDVMINVAEINVDFKLDSSSILREAFELTERFCDHNGIPNFATKFKTMFRLNYDDISNFIDVLAKEANMPNLVRNRFPNSL